MKQPHGLIYPDYPQHVCKLKKANGLKQAPCAWFNKFNSFLLSPGVVRSQANTFIFVYSQGATIMILVLYVDDIILTGSSSSVLHNFISLLSHKFPMKHLGDCIIS